MELGVRSTIHPTAGKGRSRTVNTSHLHWGRRDFLHFSSPLLREIDGARKEAELVQYISEKTVRESDSEIFEVSRVFGNSYAYKFKFPDNVNDIRKYLYPDLPVIYILFDHLIAKSSYLAYLTIIKRLRTSLLSLNTAHYLNI